MRFLAFVLLLAGISAEVSAQQPSNAADWSVTGRDLYDKCTSANT
jgi:hypothetical protein